MYWNLSLAINILLASSIAMLLATNKKGLLCVALYVAFSYRLNTVETNIIYIASIFIYTLVFQSKVEIRGMLIGAITLMTISTTYAFICLARVYGPSSVPPDIFLLRDLTAFSALFTGLVYLIPKHRHTALAYTLIVFAIFFYSYSNPIFPFKYLRVVSHPFAVLSLLPYLGITIITHHYNGSLIQRFVRWSKKSRANKALMVGGGSGG